MKELHQYNYVFHLNDERISSEYHWQFNPKQQSMFCLAKVFGKEKLQLLGFPILLCNKSMKFYLQSGKMSNISKLWQPFSFFGGKNLQIQMFCKASLTFWPFLAMKETNYWHNTIKQNMPWITNISENNLFQVAKQ